MGPERLTETIHGTNFRQNTFYGQYRGMSADGSTLQARWHDPADSVCMSYTCVVDDAGRGTTFLHIQLLPAISQRFNRFFVAQ